MTALVLYLLVAATMIAIGLFLLPGEAKADPELNTVLWTLGIIAAGLCWGVFVLLAVILGPIAHVMMLVEGANRLWRDARRIGRPSAH